MGQTAFDFMEDRKSLDGYDTAFINRMTPAPCGSSAIIHTDGSCPKNPGMMGIGYHVEETSTDGEKVEYEAGYRVGIGTNNKAEYLALIAAMRVCLERCVTHARIFMDAQIVVRQMTGAYKVKSGSLRMLNTEAMGLARLFTKCEFIHVPRDKNAYADTLSHSPTEPVLPPSTVEIQLKGSRIRVLNRTQAAMVRYWWEKGLCRNENRLQRIFGKVSFSTIRGVGMGKTYRDLRVRDLPH